MCSSDLAARWAHRAAATGVRPVPRRSRSPGGARALPESAPARVSCRRPLLRPTMTSPRSSGSAPPLDPRTRVQFLPGIGPQRALAFERLGITTLEHLVRHVPRTWLDASRFVKVRDLRPGELVTVMGTIKHASALRTRGGRGDFAATLVDETGTLAMYFFGQSWLARTLAAGTRVVVSGELGAGLERQMLNPMFEVLEGEVEDLLLEDFMEPPWCLAVEWPEKVAGWLPAGALHLDLGIKPPQAHHLRLRA